MKGIFLATLAVTAFFLLLVGCSDDDPVEPVIPPPNPSVAATPDSLMGLYRTALEEMDADSYPLLFTDDFRMWLHPAEGNYGDVPATFMTGDETILAGLNMFSGEAVTNWQGASVPGVTRFTIHEWTRVTEWAQPKSGDEMPPPLPKETVSSLWSLRMFVERGTGYPMLAAAGVYEIQAEKQSLEGEDDLWAIRTIQPMPDGKTESLGWVGVNLLYMTNEAPTAVLEVTETPTDTWPEYTFDPTGSSDEDSGLADLPFRYREGGEIFIGDPPPWTDWTAEPYEVTFETEEQQIVTVEVRDRWGATGQASKTVQPYRDWLPFPESPAQLMSNFVATYENQDVDEYQRLLHPDFVTILQQETVDQFPDVGPTLDWSEEMRIHDRMFSGDDLVDPNGEYVPGVEAISFGKFQPQMDWQLSPADDPIPNVPFAPYEVEILFNRGQGHSQISVKGQIRFYVAARDSLHEGTNRQYFEMVGQLDLTGFFKAVEEANWGTTKALYR